MFFHLASNFLRCLVVSCLYHKYHLEVQVRLWSLPKHLKCTSRMQRAADVTVVKAMCRNLPGWQRNTSGGQVSDVDVGEMQTWNTECHIVPGQCCTLSALRAHLVLSLILWNTLRCLRLSFRNKKKKSRLIGLHIQKKQVASKQQQKTLSRNFNASYKCKCEQ